ncbi:MAG: class I SAM-dependent methyltransferase [Cyclobacteriaceae bacterium]
MKEFWNERYSEAGFAYGKEPNAFFAQELDKVAPGNLILPCEGEGRNAAYAATKGWKTYAFDFSEEAKKKALQWANELQVSIKYDVANVLDADFEKSNADVVAFIYAHFPDKVRPIIHQKAVEWLKPGGKIILEAFNTHQLANTSGGPKERSMLYSKEILQADFNELDINLLTYNKIELKEGKYHKGKADVIRMVATKK